MRESMRLRILGAEPMSRWLLAVVAIGLAVAVWLRMAPLFADFAFGDGGLFWVMARDLRENGFIPPDFTTYNTGDIPWVYPPLGLYVDAILGDSLDLFRILPAFWAIATIPAVWLLARALVSERAALIATIAYGLTAPAYAGLITGGGVTRAPGLLFAVLTMWAMVTGHVGRAGVFGGLTLLTHPIAAFYGALSAMALWATRGAPVRMLVAPGISLAIAAAWFVPMALRHGVAPLLAGAGSRDLDLLGNLVELLAVSVNPPNLAFTIGAVGIVVAIIRRRWDLLAWVGVTALGVAVLDRWLAVPLAILAGFALDDALSRWSRRAAVGLVAVAVATVGTGVLLAAPDEPLPVHEREVAEWARSETPPDAVFAVIGYPADRGMVDWFPALSGRQNLSTWQGTEWIPGRSRREDATAIASCRGLGCLPDATYFVLRPECCPDLISRMSPVGTGVFVRSPKQASNP
jgi:hypothetical protein